MIHRMKAMEVRRDFSEAATQYDEYALLQRLVLRRVISLLPPLPADARLLDAGCGTGAIVDIVDKARIIGLDFASGMCHQAAARGVAALCADICAIPLSDHSVDAIVCASVLQWVSSHVLALQELRRVARPGAIAAIAVFSEGTLNELRGVFSSSEARVLSFPSADALAAAARYSGWDVSGVWEDHHTRHHPSLRSLMHELKAIGASNKMPSRRRGLTTPDTFERAEILYHHRHSTPQGVASSWNVSYLRLEKK